MECSLSLYILKHVREDKNFVIPSGIHTLNDRSDVAYIDHFQFQRPTLYKTIKIDKSQLESLDFVSSKKWNYLEVSFTKAIPDQLPEGATYYYFITKITQKAQSTLELELKMDVLNTFKFVSARNGANPNIEYTLSDKSLITREHKDRFIIGDEEDYIISSYEELKSYTNRLLLLNQAFIEALSSSPNSYTLDEMTDLTNLFSPNDPNLCLFQLKIYDSDDNVVLSPDDYPSAFPHPAHNISFEFDGSNTIITYGLLQPRGGIPPLPGFKVEDTTLTISGHPSRVEIMFTQLPVSLIPPIPGEPDPIPADFGQFINDTLPSDFDYEFGRKIDRFPEGIETILFKSDEDGETTLWDNDYENTWYICYSSESAVVSASSDTEAIFVNPVQICLYSDKGYGTTIHVASIKRIRPNDIQKIPNNQEWLEFDVQSFPSGAYISFAGITIDNTGVYDGNTYAHFWFVKKNDNDSKFRYVYASTQDNPALMDILVAENVEFVDCYGFNTAYLWTALLDGTINSYYGEFSINAGATDTAYTSPEIKEVDITDPKLIKIINVPYAPREDLIDVKTIPADMVWNSGRQAFEIDKSQYANFDRTIHFPTNPMWPLVFRPNSYENLKRAPRDIYFESKLYNSDYYCPKFVYDSFSFAFRLEFMNSKKYIEDYALADFQVRYVVSNNVNSKFMFQFLQYVCDYGVQDYNNVLVIERNNEIALYTNAYINYIRSGGYRADTKNADMQKLTNGLTIALSTIGAIASFASSSVTGGVGIAGGIGLLVGTAGKTISAIHSAQQADRDIAQKLLSTSQQATSVSTSEDISILRAYSGNKAKLCFYQLSDYTRSAMWDLFHYFGYKCHEYKVPNVNTRCNFNFVQGEIVLNEYSFSEEIAQEIMLKWKQGITFFHPIMISGAYSVDYNQEYENVENTYIEWIEED